MFPINIDAKTGKKTTTQTYKGKVSTNGDYKLFKQLMYVTGNAVVEMDKVKTEVKMITYKSYGKDIVEEVALLTDLTDKELYIGIKASCEYNYEDGETDKTSYKVDRDGNLRYKLSLNSVYDSNGKNPKEMIQEGEATQMDKDHTWLTSDKSIWKPKLEEVEFEEEVSEDAIPSDEIAF
jgi:hypothetical protein